jgi:hypothetical protein
MTAEFLPAAYERARGDASLDSGLEMDRFPEQCPWTFEEIMRPDFFPSPESPRRKSAASSPDN